MCKNGDIGYTGCSGKYLAALKLLIWVDKTKSVVSIQGCRAF